MGEFLISKTEFIFFISWILIIKELFTFVTKLKKIPHLIHGMIRDVEGLTFEIIGTFTRVIRYI